MKTHILLNQLLILLLFSIYLIPCDITAQTNIAFWNLENYYDTYNDTTTDDDEFTPQGMKHWNKTKFEKKKNDIVKIIAAMKYPSIIGLSEVENKKVLVELTQGTPLRKMKYEIIHHNSPDKRGIDCAIIFQPQKNKLIEEKAINVSDSINDFFTRDILMACFSIANNDTLYLFVNHWPSKLNIALSKKYRKKIIDKLVTTMDSIHTLHRNAIIIAMGDFNATYDEIKTYLKKDYIVNLMDTIKPHQGSYNYHGTWQLIDNIIGIGCEECHGSVFYNSNLMEKDSKYLSVKPKRTYIGYKYNTGASDHMPIQLIISQKHLHIKK